MVLYPGKTKVQYRIRDNSMYRKIIQPDVPLLAKDDRACGLTIGVGLDEGLNEDTGTTGEGVGFAATGEAVGDLTTEEGDADVGLTTGEGVDIA
eukprot:CAMPEP_0194323468 /NCGR_PEP_ID=MMETSP0171-20130528/25771_1 /TAXON_ID=218684 /ORGANISM="Corethron pennatum, Strain L29A3" /LENGTH=93 /DNA_ID=CAMNT_0039082127 /DNA_START=106 /DNA_END=384 /DNA_ORIENTATION=+